MQAGDSMIQIPDFTKVDFADAPLAGAQTAIPWKTPEGIAVKGAYGNGDVEGLPYVDGYPGIAPYLRPLPDHVRRPAVDHSAIRRLLHGGRLQCLLPAQSRRRPEGPLHRFRSRHP